MVDTLASEYGYKIEYIMDLPCDVVSQLIHAVLHRGGVRTFRKQFEKDNEAGTLSERLDAIWNQVDN